MIAYYATNLIQADIHGNLQIVSTHQQNILGLEMVIVQTPNDKPRRLSPSFASPFLNVGKHLLIKQK